jgi:hypothetical protein
MSNFIVLATTQYKYDDVAPFCMEGHVAAFKQHAVSACGICALQRLGEQH